MKLTIFHISYILACQLYASEASKILGIFLAGTRSNFLYNNAIMKSLITAGHEVTIITPFFEQAAAENYTSNIDFSAKKKVLVGTAAPRDFVSGNIFTLMNRLIEHVESDCFNFMNLAEIQRILNSKEKLYDVVFVEINPLYNCFLHVAEKMKVPVIGTISYRTLLYGDYVMNNPNHPVYIPVDLVERRWKLDHILGRMINVWNSLVIAWYKNFVVPSLVEKFHRDHADQLGALDKYRGMEPDLVFYNNYPSILPKPMNPNAIDIGGIHLKDAKSLPKGIQKFIDEAKHGVILFSMGSVVRATGMSSEKKEAFRDAFAEIPQRVVWKFEEKLENLSDNVMVLDWLPQRDILEHKNVIAFISHCGLGATYEAVYTATPVVACPLFIDQPANVESLEKLGVAVHLEYEEITKETVLKALNAIINDTRYYDNMQKVSKIFKDRPMTPQQSVVHWTEYVIRHNGAAHLKNPASRYNLLQYLLLDVAFVLVLILLVGFYLINRIFKILYARLTSSKTTSFNKPSNKKL